MEVEPPHTAAARTGAAGGGAPSSGSAAQRRESLVQPAGGAAAGVLAPIAITWSSLVGGVVKGLTPDVDGGVVAKVLLLLCLIVATEVRPCHPPQRREIRLHVPVPLAAHRSSMQQRKA